MGDSVSNTPLDVEIRSLLKTTGDLYSPEAQQEIENVGADYAFALTREAARIAAQSGVQTIATVHVSEAKRRLLLSGRRDWKKNLANTLGGTLFGLGASPFVALGSGAQTSNALVITAAVLLVIGTLLVMFGVWE